jgi:SAM-dependent methyltransferase
MTGASDSPESRRRPESFDGVAAQYDAFRPAPPVEVVAAVVESSRLHPGSRVLEIGCGTGQLSVPLAERGVDLVAIEPGTHLAAFAERNLARFARARVELSSFEAWRSPERAFDAVVCANAFHWLDPETRFTKCAEVLRPEGRLLILHTHHVAGGTAAFFADAQPIYLKWGLSTNPGFRPPEPDDVAASYPEVDANAAFFDVTRQRFEIPMPHTTASYVGWLETDSVVNTLDDDSRRGFLDDIAQLIASRYGGSVVRNFVYELVVAQRV